MIVNVSVYPLNDLLTYSVPVNLINLINIGTCVKIPLGRRQSIGYVVNITQDSNLSTQGSEFQIKDLIDVEYDGAVFFDVTLVELIEWLSKYYNVSFSRILDTALVKYVKAKSVKKITLKTKDFSNIKGCKQLEILKIINENDGVINYDEILSKFKNISKIINTLEEKEIISITESKVNEFNSMDNCSYEIKKDIKLSDEQTKAVNVISADILQREFHTYLLHGVTGSGKTEVYIELIRTALKNGQCAMLIVPEISLTPQLLYRFKAGIDANIAVLHSGISPNKRSYAWMSLASGKCKFVIGARSGVFAPIKNLGVIIVDEEHDASFKQNDSFRYSARDIAIMRAKFSSCPVVLGSATPSLESYYNAFKRKYRKISLKNRFSQHQKLNFEVVNLNKIKKSDFISNNITPQLYDSINERLQKNEQVFILYNKRGFASFLQCEVCGESVKCPNCSITLTYHKNEGVLKCHQCDYQSKLLKTCPECEKNNEENKLILKGAGTEKIFDELKLLFPNANIARLDRDEVTTLKQYEKILQDVRDNKVNILVGTQMIAKGHDIPNVSLVVVVDCDISLYFPDFRATEKTFQLLTQVAGRAGRGDIPGTVILQTRNPEHLAIVHTIQSDYQGFANNELKLRREMNYPPFSFLVRLIVSNNINEIAQNDIMCLRELIRAIISKLSLKVQVLGPAPAYIEKIKNAYRWNIILKSENRSDLNVLISFINISVKLNSKTKFIVDIDPQDMF